MTKNEAEIVLGIMSRADGECQHCARELYKEFIREFPKYEKLAKDIFKTIFDIEWGEH
jgi:hypothetical protein